MRFDNWNILFVEEIQRLRADPSAVEFGWVPPSSQPLGGAQAISGQTSATLHCISFASHMVEVITGKNYYAEMASHLEYNDPKSAMLAMRSLGFKSVDQLIGSIFPAQRLSKIIRGDLVIVLGEDDTGVAVGVADPPLVWLVYGNAGLVNTYMSHAIQGFKVE